MAHIEDHCGAPQVLAIVPVVRSNELDGTWPVCGDPIYLRQSRKAYWCGAPVGEIISDDTNADHFVGVCASDSTQINSVYATMGVCVKAVTVVVSGAFVRNNKTCIIVPGRGIRCLS